MGLGFFWVLGCLRSTNFVLVLENVDTGGSSSSYAIRTGCIFTFLVVLIFSLAVFFEKFFKTTTGGTANSTTFDPESFLLENVGQRPVESVLPFTVSDVIEEPSGGTMGTIRL